MLVTELESVWIISSNFSATARDSYQPSVLGFSYHPVSGSGTHASVDVDTEGGLPPSFTVCVAMVKTWTNGASTSMYVFPKGKLFNLSHSQKVIWKQYLDSF